MSIKELNKERQPLMIFLPDWILVHFSKTLKSLNLADTTKRTIHPGADKE